MKAKGLINYTYYIEKMSFSLYTVEYSTVSHMPLAYTPFFSTDGLNNKALTKSVLFFFLSPKQILS